MWFKMGGQRIEEAIPEAPPVPAVGGAPAIVDAGLGGGFPARPTETPAADMARDIRNDMANAQATEAAAALANPAPEPIGAVDRSSVDALNAEIQKIQGDQAARENPAVSIDVNPGPGFGQNIIDATRKPWSGGRRPKGAVVDAPPADTSGTGDAVEGMPVGTVEEAAEDALAADPAVESQANGEVAGGTLMNSQIRTEDTSGVGAMQVGEIGTAAGTDGGDSSIVTSENTGESKDPVAPVQDAGTSEAEDTQTSTNPEVNPMIGVGVPPPGETYPNMQPPTPNIWVKPNDGQPVTDPNPMTGVAIPAPRELTQEEKDRQADREDDEAYRQKIMSEGLGDNDNTVAPLPPLSPNAGDKIEPSNTQLRGDVLTEDATNALREQGVIKTEEGSEVIDATQTAPSPGGAVDSPAVQDEVVPVVGEDQTAAPEAVTDEVVRNDTSSEVASVVTPDAGTAVTEAEGSDDQAVVETPSQEGDAGVSVGEVVPAAVDEAAESSEGVEDSTNAIDASTENPTGKTREDSDSKIMGRGEDDDHTEGSSDEANARIDTNRELQETADKIASMPIRDAIIELKNAPTETRTGLINRVARETVFKQLESEGIVNVIDMKDPRAIWTRISGMTALFNLWVKESQGYIASDEKTVSLNETLDDANSPADQSTQSTDAA